MHRQYRLTDKIKIQRIPYCRNSYKILEKIRRTRQTDTSNAQIHDRSLSCFGTCALIQTCGVKRALWAQTSNLNSMFANYAEKTYPIEYESKILHIHLCLFHRFTSKTDHLWNWYQQNARVFFIDNIFVMFSKRDFQQEIGIPMCRNCAPFLADLLLYSYETDFIQGLLTTRS
jgi:hypothetical protein